MTSVGQQRLDVRIPALPPLAVWPWQVTLKLSLFYYYERYYKSRDDPPSQTHCILLLFSRAIVSNSLQPHGLQHARLPCPSLSPRVCSNSCPLSRWCYPTISSSVTCFSSCLQSFPASGSFPMSWLSASGGQSFRASASASVLPMNIQGWLPLGLTGLISVLSKGLSRVFSSTTIQKHQFFAAQPFLRSNSHIHTRLLEKPELWLYGPLRQQRDVSAF